MKKQYTKQHREMLRLTAATVFLTGGLLCGRAAVYAAEPAAILLEEPAVVLTEQTETAEVLPEEELTGTPALPDSEELFEGYTEQVLYEDVQQGAFPIYYAPRAARLSGKDLTVYEKLKAAIVRVAEGAQEDATVSFTMEELGLKTAYSYAELGLSKGASQQEIINAMKTTVGSYTNVVDSLLTDLPYELYWFDKKTGYGRTHPGIAYDNTTIRFTTNLIFRFYVAEAFAKEGTRDEHGRTSHADKTKTVLTVSAKTKASEIVAAYAGLSDIEKLTAYRDEICDRVDYNYSATAAGTPYGNPWQMLWVFDDDPGTKVVCEGYAKAFQYLCDLSSFTSELTQSQIMTGRTSGNHMWNVVSMDNGLRYLVDITNCDNSRDTYFLKGDPEGTELGYSVGGIIYVYDGDTNLLYTEKERRISEGESYQKDVTDSRVYPDTIHLRELALEQKTLSLEEEATAQLKAILTPADATNQRLTWTSSNPRVASVTEEGLITAHRAGTVTVTVTSQDGGFTDQCTVTITAVETYSMGTWTRDKTSWRYRLEDGSYVKNAWYRIDGKWYHFDGKGYMQTGWIKISGKWYYLDGNGVMVTGWYDIDGDRYRFDERGMMQTGWLKDGGKWYYLKSSGVMVTGWQKVGKKWYYMNGSGVMQTGWKKISGKWYLLDHAGVMQTGWTEDDGKWYYLNKKSGIMTTGWLKSGKKWYYLKPSGEMQTGWRKISGKWYYFESSGRMLASTSRKIGKKTYRFNASGVCTNP